MIDNSRILWSQKISTSMQDLFDVQDEICERVTQSLAITWRRNESDVRLRDVPATAKAYEYYLRGNQLAASRLVNEMELARDLYLECVAESPGYGPAWARLGRAYHFLQKFGGGAEGDLARAEEAFRRAFDLNPNLTSAHHFFTSVECAWNRGDASTTAAFAGSTK